MPPPRQTIPQDPAGALGHARAGCTTVAVQLRRLIEKVGPQMTQAEADHVRSQLHDAASALEAHGDPHNTVLPPPPATTSTTTATTTTTTRR